MVKKKSRLDKIGEAVERGLPVVLIAMACALFIAVAVLVVKMDDVTVVQPPDITVVDVLPTATCQEDEVLTFSGECKHIETFETEVLIPIPVSQDEIDKRNEAKGTPPAPVELPETGR